MYTRYIRKGKKRFGPYYYKNVRDRDGKVRNVFIGIKPPVDYFVRPDEHSRLSRESAMVILNSAVLSLTRGRMRASVFSLSGRIRNFLIC
jgi:hypothetical protein